MVGDPVDLPDQRAGAVGVEHRVDIAGGASLLPRQRHRRAADDMNLSDDPTERQPLVEQREGGEHAAPVE